MGYGFWKSKVRAHNQHPNEMFQQHLNGGKYKKESLRRIFSIVCSTKEA